MVTDQPNSDYIDANKPTFYASRHNSLVACIAADNLSFYSIVVIKYISNLLLKTTW